MQLVLGPVQPWPSNVHQNLALACPRDLFPACVIWPSGIFMGLKIW